MTDATAAGMNKPIWVDLSSVDPTASRKFYASLFGWEIAVSPDPQYGGYAMARIGDTEVAGIGPTQSADAPTAWMIYLGTQDIERLAAAVLAAGGAVIAPPFDVADQGRMAVFQDPSGAFISGWQPKAMGGFARDAPNTFAWAELNSRGIELAIPFYHQAFGWTHLTREMGEGAPPYTEFQVGGLSIAGGMEMNPMVPAQVPSYWMVYFAVDDVDGSFRTAIEAGGREMLPPRQFPGGRFAILGDPQGAVFGLIKMAER
jgi:uncharacterized protein